jgi:hypothetical protein
MNDVIDAGQATFRLRPEQPMRVGDDPDPECHGWWRPLCAPRSIFDFGHSRYHSAVQNVSEQILEDHLPMSFLKELRSLYKRLPGSLDDDAEGAPV